MLYDRTFEQCNDQTSNYIYELIKKIDKIQKSVINVDENICIGCEMALLASAANTVPISIYTDCCSAFTAVLDLTGATTNVFRIESIKCDRYVTLRLLEITTDDPAVNAATTRTIVLDIENIRGLQCYEPITVEPCINS